MNNAKQILAESSSLFLLLGAGMNSAGGGRTFFSSLTLSPIRYTFFILRFSAVRGVSPTESCTVYPLSTLTSFWTLCCYSSDRFSLLPSIIFCRFVSLDLLCFSSFIVLWVFLLCLSVLFTHSRGSLVKKFAQPSQGLWCCVDQLKSGFDPVLHESMMF